MFVYVSRGMYVHVIKARNFMHLYFINDFWQYIFEIYLWKLKMESLCCLDLDVDLILYFCGGELSIGSLSYDGKFLDTKNKLQYIFFVVLT